jgi:hypothetical protein
MSRKHYEQAAEQILKCGHSDKIRKILANEFADFFASENSRFNRAKFYIACGVLGSWSEQPAAK